MNTDKKMQTVYTPFDLNSEIKFSLWGKKHENVYIFTHEEMEALKAEWKREADLYGSKKVAFFTLKNGKYITETGVEITTKMLLENEHTIFHDSGWILSENLPQPPKP